MNKYYWMVYFLACSLNTGRNRNFSSGQAMTNFVRSMPNKNNRIIQVIKRRNR